eukprot:2196894-Rhodomonas_salina.2
MTLRSTKAHDRAFSTDRDSGIGGAFSQPCVVQSRVRAGGNWPHASPPRGLIHACALQNKTNANSASAGCSVLSSCLESEVAWRPLQSAAVFASWF